MSVTKKKSGFFSTNIGEMIYWIVIIFLIRTFGFGLYQVPTGSMETTMLVGERFFADKLSYIFVKPKQGDIISFNDPLFDYSDNKAKRLFQEYVWGPSNWTKRLIAVPGQTVEGKIEDGKPVVYVDGVKLDEPYVNKYPLVAVFESDKKDLRADAEKQALKLLNHGYISMAKFESCIQEQINCSARWKSYDPTKSPEQQPFYRLQPDRIVEVDNGMVLREPGTPLERNPRIMERREGKSHWNGTDEFYVELGKNQYWAMGDNRLGSHDCRFFGPLDGRLIHGKIVFCIFSLDSKSDWLILDILKYPIDFWTRVRWSRCLHFMH